MAWLHLRQALSLSLLTGRDVAIPAGHILASSFEARATFDDIAEVLERLCGSRPIVENGTVVFTPRPLKPGRYRIDTGPYSSAIEPVLLLMPALFHCDFRSVIECTGVTHSPLSYPTAFVKETLLALLERLGFMGSLRLSRFGFHGSGGGAVEARIYPRESIRGAIPFGERAELVGARVIFSHVSRELAEMEKRMIADRLRLAEDRVSILEVVDADGCGNSLSAVLNLHGIAIVIFREIAIVDRTGRIIVSEKDVEEAIDAIADEALRAVDLGITDRLAGELIPYCRIAGIDAPRPIGPLSSLSEEVCATMLEPD